MQLRSGSTPADLLRELSQAVMRDGVLDLHYTPGPNYQALIDFLPSLALPGIESVQAVRVSGLSSEHFARLDQEWNISECDQRYWLIQRGHCQALTVYMESYPRFSYDSVDECLSIAMTPTPLHEAPLPQLQRLFVAADNCDTPQQIMVNANL